MRPLGFCIVGCGMIARFHALALADVENARLVAIVSRTPGRAESLLAELSIPTVPIHRDIESALSQADVDAIIICTPSGAHLEPAIAAARAGKHVVVEKPLEINVERCDAIIDACDDAGVHLATIFPSRFHEANIALKDAVDAGRFGRLTLAEVTCKWWRSQDYYDEGGWKGTQSLDGGGALMNQAIHSVDLLLWMMGPVETVFGMKATLAHQHIEVEDTAVAVVRFVNGALGVIQAATSVYPGLSKTIAVHGDQGTVIVEQEDIVRWDFRTPISEDAATRLRFAQKSKASGGASDPKAISHGGHTRQLCEFVNAVLCKRTPAVDGREGRRAVELIEAIYESERIGRPVHPHN